MIQIFLIILNIFAGGLCIWRIPEAWRANEYGFFMFFLIVGYLNIYYALYGLQQMMGGTS